MDKKTAKEIIEGFIQEKHFIRNFGGGSIEEAMKVAIACLGEGEK